MDRKEIEKEFKEKGFKQNLTKSVDSVLKGLKEAENGKFSTNPPDLKEEEKLMEDDE